VPKFLLKISQFVGLMFFVLLGVVSASSSAMAHTVAGQYVKSSVVTSKTANAAKATDFQTIDQNSGQTNTGCEKSCSFSCPPSTCMTGIISHFGNFGIDAGYSYLMPGTSLQTNYASLVANLFRPPRQ